MAGEASAVVFAVESGEDTGTPAAPQDAAEDQEAVHQNPGHALGREWPQQVTGRHCWIGHTLGAPALRRFPTRKSFGREPIGLDFRVTAGRNRPFVPTPQEEDEKAIKEGARTEREVGGIGEGEGSERPEDGEEMTAGEASVAVCAVESGEDTGTPAAQRDAVEDQEEVHQNPGHALGRAWPQQVWRAGLNKIKGKEEGKREGE
ncbi:hypothetical protein NDU88_001133 [Pleurodeles waltl]|uniref:Uncharacterized protein n=1 Tax=Pleurodeles waltl TaxID=8319 RepID=A0AAV7LBQ0_PLEWA|nr:hypothetical protein NDU88_001133 [Pleurodeles waltl]